MSDLGPRTPWPADRPAMRQGSQLPGAGGAGRASPRPGRAGGTADRGILRFSWVECGETVGQKAAFDGVLGE